MLLTYSFAVFAIMLAVVGGAGYWVLVRQSDLGVASESPDAPGANRAQVGPNAPAWAGALAGVNDWFSFADEDPAALRRRLSAAGVRWDGSVAAYSGARVTLPVLVAFLSVLLTVVTGAQWGNVLLLIPLGAYLAYLLPERIVRRKTERRRAAINQSLPDFLDLLVIAIESGLSMDQAVVDTARDLRRAHPVLADELFLFNRETQAGATRAEALRNLGSRSGEPELRKLCQMLIQADRFGSSVAKVLRTQARYMRIRRRQSAEEKAHKTSVKLLFPIFFLIMPSVFLVTAGPAIILLLGNFSKMAGK